MISVTRTAGTWSACWGLSGKRIYRGTDEAAMMRSIVAAFDEQDRRRKK